MNTKLRVARRYIHPRGEFILVPQYWRSDLSKWEDLPVIDEETGKALDVVPAIDWYGDLA